MPCAALTAGPVSGSPPRDCLDVLLSGQQEDGIYSVFPTHYPAGFQVYCDMRTDGGGWTVSVAGGHSPLLWALQRSRWAGLTHRVASANQGTLNDPSPSLLPLARLAAGPHKPAPHLTPKNPTPSESGTGQAEAVGGNLGPHGSRC